MKHLFFLSVLLLGCVNAQIVNIPDANFKAKLLQANETNGIAMDMDGNNIAIDTNADGEIQISEALTVYWLYIYGNENLPELQINDLTGIEAFENLEALNCRQNNLTELNVANLINLKGLVCGENELTHLDVSSLLNLELLYCNSNNLTSIDISNLTLLEHLYLDHNFITSLDCSVNPNLQFVSVYDNQLTHLNVKNGTPFDEDQYYLEDNISAFAEIGDFVNICADDFEIAFLESILYNDYQWNLNTYCTQEPGGDFNTIIGILLYDSNNDGQCDENDFPQPFIKINNTDGTSINSYFSDNQAEYVFYTMDGSFTLSPQLENPDFFNINPQIETVNFPLVDNSIEIRNFCITPNDEHSDLEVMVAPVIPAIPGSISTYKIVYRNQGNQTVSGTVNFEFDDERTDFISSLPLPDIQSSGLLSFDFSGLHPFENREIIIRLDVNDSSDFPPVEAGDELIFTADIQSALTDENPADNIYPLNHKAVADYEPNDLICLEGNSVPTVMIGEELHYFIRFQNTGTETVENIVISMEIDPEKYDVPSLMVLNSSHEVKARVTGNTTEFFLPMAMLETGGHGNILLKIKTKDHLTAGDIVKSSVNIYFDYNYPVVSEDEETVFENLQAEDVSGSIEIQVFPNPVEDILNIQSDSKIKLIEIYSVSGRLMQISLINDFETGLNLSALPNGTYFVKIKTDKRTMTKKVIKK